MPDCFIDIDKPAGITSAGVVARLKGLLFPRFGKFRIGHAGTLDPMATGVLPVACGEATKALPYMPDTDKEYVFDVTFGRSTATDDAWGETSAATDRIPAMGEIERILPSFTGEIMQAPPAYSAIKVDGKRAHALARKGGVPVLKPRAQVVYSLKFIGPASDDAATQDAGRAAAGEGPHKAAFRFEVVADRGFYVRALARDMALALGSLGFASSIRRIRSGPFEIGRSITLDKLASMLDNGGLLDARAQDFCLEISRSLDGIPAVDMDEGRNEKLRNGMSVPFDGGDFPLLQILCRGELSAIARSNDGTLSPIRVFNIRKEN